MTEVAQHNLEQVQTIEEDQVELPTPGERQGIGTGEVLITRGAGQRQVTVELDIDGEGGVDTDTARPGQGEAASVTDPNLEVRARAQLLVHPLQELRVEHNVLSATAADLTDGAHRRGWDDGNMTVKVSVIVPVYNPGDRILRVIRSLDRQTMGTHDFEAVFVDDGSTDGTADRLHRLAAQRPNMRVARMPNSGWPSWPRNVGIGLARGDYLLFMDHDDELGDDALRRAYDFAVLHGSDVVIGKEVAVGRSALESEMWRRNVPRASIVQHQLLSLLTVHRLFRRKLLLTHDIRFPERVGLLEDQPFALKSYLTADTVSVLADYPVYRWIVQEGTSSQRQPNLETAHANIRECVDLVESYTSSGPERDAMLGRWLGSLADSVGPRLLRRPAESWSKWLNDVRRLVEERFPARLDALATPIQRIRLAALRAGDLDALVALAQLRAGALSPGPDAWLRLARRRPRRPGDGDTGGSERSADGVRAGRRPVDPPRCRRPWPATHRTASWTSPMRQRQQPAS